MKERDRNLTEEEILNRIQSLLQFKHWSIYRLAKESGLPCSTLYNIFNRQTCPGIAVLRKICRGFGISLSQFFECEENSVGKQPKGVFMDPGSIERQEAAVKI